MPIYEYQCGNCEHRMEAIQKISDDPLTDCPECKQETLRKLVSAAAFKLTGTGWYETDFKDKKPKTADNKSVTEEKSTDSKDGDKAGDKTGTPETSKETQAKDTGDSADKDKTAKSSDKSETKTEAPKKKAATTQNNSD